MNACRDHVEILSISLFCANGFYPFTSLLRSRVHVAIFVFSFSPFSQLLPEAVYKSGRRLHPPATLYRTDERERHEGRDGGRKGGRVRFRSEGTRGVRLVPLPHPVQRSDLDALWDSVTGILDTRYGLIAFFLPFHSPADLSCAFASAFSLLSSTSTYSWCTYVNI